MYIGTKTKVNMPKGEIMSKNNKTQKELDEELKELELQEAVAQESEDLTIEEPQEETTDVPEDDVIEEAGSDEPTLEEVIKNLEKMSDSYHEKVKLVEEEMPETLGLTKKSEVEVDEEGLREKVEQEATADYDTKKQRLEDEIIADQERLETEITSQESAAASQRESIDSTMDAMRLVAENDALKRGLARSSIVVSRLGNIEDSRAEKLIDLSNTLSSKLTSIEKEIDDLNAKREVSLSNLDIELALEIENRLASKVAELKKTQEGVLEYNNKITQLEAEYQADRSKKMSDQKKAQYEFESKYGDDIKKQIMTDKYNYVSDYLNTMTKQEAITVLMTNPEFAQQLGDYFYDLYYTQSRRK